MMRQQAASSLAEKLSSIPMYVAIDGGDPRPAFSAYSDFYAAVLKSDNVIVVNDYVIGEFFNRACKISYRLTFDDDPSFSQFKNRRSSPDLPAEEVGAWAKDKHQSLYRYVDISRGVRSKWLDTGKAGATSIDLFCDTGRAKVRRTGEYIDGSSVAAWKSSFNGGTPFSEVIIADADPERRELAAKRLRRLNAPVVEVEGDASTSVASVISRLNAHGLHFAFLDPYNLGSFDFNVMRSLAGLKHIDVLVHISKMDLQRNLGMNVRAQQTALDRFAPGWRDAVDVRQSQSSIRRDVFEFWRKKVAGLGIDASADMQLITGTRGQHLYWLTLVARHSLAHAFWKVASNKEKQGELF